TWLLVCGAPDEPARETLQGHVPIPGDECLFSCRSATPIDLHVHRAVGEGKVRWRLARLAKAAQASGLRVRPVPLLPSLLPDRPFACTRASAYRGRIGCGVRS